MWLIIERQRRPLDIASKKSNSRHATKKDHTTNNSVVFWIERFRLHEFKRIDVVVTEWQQIKCVDRSITVMVELRLKRRIAI